MLDQPQIYTLQYQLPRFYTPEREDILHLEQKERAILKLAEAVEFGKIYKVQLTSENRTRKDIFGLSRDYRLVLKILDLGKSKLF